MTQENNQIAIRSFLENQDKDDEYDIVGMLAYSIYRINKQEFTHPPTIGNK